MDREPQTARERAVLLLRATLLPGRLPTTSQGLVWAIRGAIVLGVLVLIASAVDRSLWDWLELLIVPAVIAGGGIWFNRQQQERQQEDNRQQREREQEVENQRAQDEALQAYLDRMSELLLEKNLHKKDNPYDPTRVTARARTLAVLRQLGGSRKRVVLLFLRESRLINSKARCWGGRLAAHARLVGLENANLRNADLREARLISTSRREAVSLEGADLEGADLTRADLERADLQKVVLKGANLRGACLKGADLRDAVGVTNAELDRQAASLTGATMPNGQKYEDWLKSKDSEEDEENTGP